MKIIKSYNFLTFIYYFIYKQIRHSFLSKNLNLNEWEIGNLRMNLCIISIIKKGTLRTFKKSNYLKSYFVTCDTLNKICKFLILIKFWKLKFFHSRLILVLVLDCLFVCIFSEAKVNSLVLFIF